jgi:hypothetical protein
MTHMSDALGFFKSGVAFFQFSSQRLAFFVGALAFGHVANYTDVLDRLLDSEAIGSFGWDDGDVVTDVRSHCPTCLSVARIALANGSRLMKRAPVDRVADHRQLPSR